MPDAGNTIKCQALDFTYFLPGAASLEPGKMRVHQIGAILVLYRAFDLEPLPILLVPLSERRHRLYTPEIPEVMRGLKLRL
ncbi:hypothetical protein HQ586_10125 [Candidatus Bathyarchaeota archaeon]|nr:hypothetical protein [Candidatus Bathyarchaeota archaeon]